jgi:SNF2 family DNA or RNA helicase
MHGEPTILRQSPRTKAYDTVQRAKQIALEEVDENDSEYVAGDDHVPNVLSKKEDTVIFELGNLQPLKTNLRAQIPKAAACVVENTAIVGRPKLKMHQVEVARKIVSQRGLIVAAGVGTGKTFLAAASMSCVHAFLHPKGFVIITPAPLVKNFADTIQRFDPSLVEKTQIITYGALVKQFGELAHKKDKRMFFKAMKHLFHGTFVVFDEIHSNAGEVHVAKTGRVTHVQAYICITAAKFAFRALGLTATPMVNEPMDVANLASIARGDGICFSRAAFNVILGDAHLRKTIFSHTFYFYDAPVTKEYPEERLASPSRCNIVLMGDDLHKYEQFEARHPDLMTGSFDGRNVEAFYNGIRRFANTLNSLKATRVIDIITHLPLSQRRTIVTSQFIEYGIKHLQDALRHSNISFVTVTGESNEKQRQKAIMSFKREEVEVLLLSVAGVQGLDFKGVRNVIIVEPF